MKKPPPANCRTGHCHESSQPRFFRCLTPKKGGGKWFYFRFLSAQYAATPMTEATATAASMATSVVMNGASAVGSSGVSGSSDSSGSVGVTGSSGSSGSIRVAGVGAGSTTM